MVMKKLVFDNKNILAPVDIQPTAILDCGCGVAGNNLDPLFLFESGVKPFRGLGN